jgi:hypothetical protein
VRKTIGNGDQTNFWCDVLAGAAPLRERFPRFFSISTQKSSSVSSIRDLSAGVMGWNLEWRRRLFVCEENLQTELREVINQVVLTDDRDRWGWIPNNGSELTVKSTYWTVVKLFVLMDIESSSVEGFGFCLATPS